MVSLRAMASNVPPMLATEEAIAGCVVFFTRRGKAARIFESKTRLGVISEKGGEKLAEAKRY